MRVLWQELVEESVGEATTDCRTHKLTPLLLSPAATPPRRPTLTTSASATPARIFVGSLDASGKKFAIVVARFNDLVTRPLLDGALDGLARHGASVSTDVDVAWVPGSFELPLVARATAASGKYAAVIAIGAIVRGATTHYDAVVSAATSGCLSASADTGVPVIFTVLTTEDMEQALDRAGGKAGNKGYEGAVTAVEMSNLMADMRGVGAAK